jgi:hypothetical protein
VVTDSGVLESGGLFSRPRSLHKRFHSANGPPVESENLLLATDCLKVTLFGREDVIRDAQKIRPFVGGSTPARTSGLKISSTLLTQGTPLIVIRACSRPAGTSEPEAVDSGRSTEVYGDRWS